MKRTLQSHLRRSALWVVLVTVITQIAAFGGVYSWSWVPAELCLTLSIAAIAVLCVWKRYPLPWHPLLWPVLLFGGLVAIQWGARLTVYPAATLTGLLELSAGGAALYLSFLSFQSTRNLKYLSTALWIFSGILAAEAIIQYFNAGNLIYWTHAVPGATPVGPYIYHNYYAGAMDLLIPISLAATLRPINRPRPDLLAIVRRSILPGLALASLIVSQSRGGLFALLFESSLALIVFWPDITSSRSIVRKTAAAIVCLVAFTALAGWAPLIKRLAHLDYHDVSALERVEVSKTCLDIWKSHPWLGTGFNTFAAIYPKFEQFDNGKLWLQAHNEYAQALAETGIVGAVLILAFLVLLIHSQWSLVRQRTHSSVEVYRKSCFIALGGFLFHAYGDFLFHSPANMLLFFVLVGAVAASATPTFKDSPVPYRRAKGLKLGEPDSTMQIIRVSLTPDGAVNSEP